jgi:hypothetical protein
MPWRRSRRSCITNSTTLASAAVENSLKKFPNWSIATMPYTVCDGSPHWPNRNHAVAARPASVR